MQSLGMKLGFIILNLLGRLAIKYEATKRPVIAKHTLGAKLLYANFFSGEGIAIQVPVKKGKNIYLLENTTDVVLKKLKKYYQKHRPVTGFKHVLHAPAHMSAINTIVFLPLVTSSFFQN